MEVKLFGGNGKTLSFFTRSSIFSICFVRLLMRVSHIGLYFYFLKGLTFSLFAILMNKIELKHYTLLCKIVKSSVIKERTWIILCKINVKRIFVSSDCKKSG